jgi:hypothetical protein
VSGISDYETSDCRPLTLLLAYVTPERPYSCRTLGTEGSPDFEGRKGDDEFPPKKAR